MLCGLRLRPGSMDYVRVRAPWITPASGLHGLCPRPRSADYDALRKSARRHNALHNADFDALRKRTSSATMQCSMQISMRGFKMTINQAKRVQT